jgi:hypothetical protein
MQTGGVLQKATASEHAVHFWDVVMLWAAQVNGGLC